MRQITVRGHSDDIIMVELHSDTNRVWCEEFKPKADVNAVNEALRIINDHLKRGEERMREWV